MLVQVWLSAELDAAGNVKLSADSDAVLSRGFAAVVVAALSDMRPDALLAADLTAAFGELGLDAASLTPSRTNGFLNLLEAVRKRVRMLTTALPSFPSLLIKRDGITAQVRCPCLLCPRHDDSSCNMPTAIGRHSPCELDNMSCVSCSSCGLY